MKSAKLTIDDKVYELSYDFNHLADVEDEVGCSLIAAIEDQGGNTARQLRGLLYAMTREQHPKLTLKECGKLIRIDTMPKITLAVGEACAIAVSEEFELQWREMLVQKPETNEPIGSQE